MEKQYEYDIVIASPNAGIDSYYLLSELQMPGVNRATRVLHTAGGKGNNMARAAVRLGGKVWSLGIVGGTAGLFVERELAREGIGHELVWTDIETRRLSTLYVEGESDTTVVLEPGQAVGDDVREAFTQCVLRNAWRAPYVALIGSLPPDFPQDYYASLVQQLKALGANVCLDSTALHLKLAAVFGPTLIKVNREEFGLAFAEPGKTCEWGFVKRIYARLREKGVKVLIVTDGAQGAFVFSEKHPSFRVATRIDTWQSTAGAGDTFLAALLLGLQRGDSIAEAARYASAAAAANLQQIGCGFLDAADVDRFLAQTTLKDM